MARSKKAKKRTSTALLLVLIALAVCAVVHPEVITKSIFTRVDIDISGGLADGQTIVDPRTYTDRPRNADFALDADRDLFARWMMDCIRRFQG